MLIIEQVEATYGALSALMLCVWPIGGLEAVPPSAKSGDNDQAFSAVEITLHQVINLSEYTNILICEQLDP
jgi:hypothetical protein